MSAARHQWTSSRQDGTVALGQSPASTGTGSCVPEGLALSVAASVQPVSRAVASTLGPIRRRRRIRC
eukprot:2994463-Pyramimonas_sp.AAC.1